MGVEDSSIPQLDGLDNANNQKDDKCECEHMIDYEEIEQKGFTFYR